jgi:hypothetical protein
MVPSYMVYGPAELKLSGDTVLLRINGLAEPIQEIIFDREAHLHIPMDLFML